MRTGSNHEYREAKRYVRQAWQARLYNAQKSGYVGDFKSSFIYEASQRWGVTERTIKRWLRG